jgi:ATP-binding cassette subfamily B protein
MYGLLLIKTRATLARNSKTISEGSAEIIKYGQIALGGMRNIIIDQNSDYFNNNFKKVNNKLRKAQANSVFIGNSPKNILEAFALVLISVIAITKSNEPGSISTVAAVVGVIAMAAQRLLPLMQQAYSAWTSFRENRESLLEIAKFIKIESRVYEYEKIQDFKEKIEFQNVGYKYKNNNTWALKPYSLKIEKGDCIAITGRTGTGKSTLLDLILGLLIPSTGKIKLDEILINLHDNKYWFNNISHVPQTIYLVDGTISENIAFGVPDNEINYQRLEIVAKIAQVTEFTSKLKMGIDSQVGENGSLLSGGQRQRIGIARALYKNSKLLILDEATSALDYETEKNILNSIRQAYADITIIAVTHSKENIKIYDKVIEL